MDRSLLLIHALINVDKAHWSCRVNQSFKSRPHPSCLQIKRCLHSSQLVIAQVESALVPTKPVPCAEVGSYDSWKSSFLQSFILIFVSVQAFWGCWPFVAGSPRWGPTCAAAADLHVCASLPTSCGSAACTDPSWLGLGFVSFNAANPQILCRTNTGQLKNDSFFWRESLTNVCSQHVNVIWRGRKKQPILAMSHGEWRFHISLHWPVWGSFTLGYLPYKHILCAFIHMYVSFPCCSWKDFHHNSHACRFWVSLPPAMLIKPKRGEGQIANKWKIQTCHIWQRHLC